MSEKLKVGAVVYAPKVTVIWKIIGDFFEKEGFGTGILQRLSDAGGRSDVR